MPHTSLSQVLLSELDGAEAPFAGFGASARPAMLLEHLIRERRMTGEILMNLEALLDCAGQCISDHAAGRLSRDDLMAALVETVQVATMELAYNEAEALAATAGA
ncbi:hypothetical protein [Mangrovicoccus sp. HB161399]|uniref:hypothetical protein n=1 Tax=Mangrovicoccus sp. HB161399 TaxID=2720392 RepID=UPI0015561630|nr:hypothetical protein [Mangrovicoccus sp. HB161399]